MRLLDVGLTSLIVVAVVVGLQMVGVVLMSAMLVAPAVAARQWTDRLGTMLLLAGLFGASAGIVGAVLSASARGLSTGPIIVLSVSSIVLFSLLFAPQRGLVWHWFQRQRNARRLRWAMQHGDVPPSVPVMPPADAPPDPRIAEQKGASR